MAPELEITSRNNALQADSELEATCRSSRGRPAGQMSWFMENDLITPVQSDTFEEIDQKNTNMTLFTVIEKITYHVKPEDNQKRLRCRVEHAGYSPEGFVEATQQIQVEYLPQAMPEQVVTGLEIGRPATLSTVIRANPRPSVEWSVSGQVIRQGEQKDRFIVEDPIEVGRDEYNVTLIITELSLEDTTRNYILKSSNRHGQQTYNLRIGSASQGDGMEIIKHDFSGLFTHFCFFNYFRFWIRNCSNHCHINCICIYCTCSGTDSCCQNYQTLVFCW